MTLVDLIRPFKDRGKPRPSDTIENPIRAELFSIERLEQHALELAAQQRVKAGRSRGRALLGRVRENRRVLNTAYRQITESVREEKTITPAGEWLVDNFFIVDEQIQEILHNLPPGFYRELPKLIDGTLAGYPRVIGVAWSFVAHTDSRLDPDWLRRFMNAYQTVEPLCIGEVWALAISLRIVLVENLRRLADRMIRGKMARDQANQLADTLLDLPGQVTAKIPITLQSFENAPLHTAFAVQLVQRLRDQGSAVAPVMEWLDKRLAEQGTTAEDIVRVEHQTQTAMSATLRNIITSMRLLSTLDWSEFVEEISVVDHILREGAGYAAMDFATRDLYRHAIEELSRGSEIPERDVARRVLRRATHARQAAAEQKRSAVQIEREGDSGYHLVSKGRLAFERELDCRVALGKQIRRFYVQRGTLAYLGSMAFTTAVVLAVPCYESYRHGMPSLLILLFAILGIIPASDIAVAVVNRLVTASIGPRSLPKLDFIKGIPEEYPTLVVIPTLLTSPEAIEECVEHLEVHYLANSEGPLQFALLTDWMDAPQEQTPSDESLLNTAVNAVNRLNHRYGAGSESRIRFLIFHRRRLWNATQGVWMGWERKRGKLLELNRLLRGETETSFMTELTPITPELRRVRYVITLDSDTRMGRGAAYRLVGTLAHPLNRAYFSEAVGSVTEGYGIIQPRISPIFPSGGNGTLFQKIFSGPTGIDPYTFAVSDVYQDLFKEGSYVGKGIYDIDAFNSALGTKVPENQMLSHDLFEGTYARTALATDVEFFEEFPSHYAVAVARSHRWIRGDWQLLSWILKPSSLPVISRWKMIDNLRRSLSPIACMATLLCAWSIRHVHASRWTTFIMATLAFSPALSIGEALIPRRISGSISNRLQSVREDSQVSFAQFILGIVFLAHHAWISVDAIVRTLFRLFISRRRLLEWTSAAQAKASANFSLGGFYVRMGGVIPLALGAGAGIFLSDRRSAVPWFFIAGWMLSPWAARGVSMAIKDPADRSLPEKERSYLRQTARQSWRFFETFVNAESHFLPPDNFQETPVPVVARRTSPTNIGLYLLSTVAAYDFGWIGLTEMLDRLEATAGTLKRLPLFRGHFYNWYDTHDCRPLDPLYVSVVDSGNLAGHLITLAEACRQLQKTPQAARERVDFYLGLRDDMRLIDELLPALQKDRHTGTVTHAQLNDVLVALRTTLKLASTSKIIASLNLDDLQKQLETLGDIAHTLVAEQENPAQKELVVWSEFLVHQLQSHRRDLETVQTTPAELQDRLGALAVWADETAHAMEFGFLFDPLKKIFAIGYQVTEKKLDPSFYDLLASEARLASFIAIAKGDVATTHWFHLGRSLTAWHGNLALLSWSGSMFEYLMPLLVMRSPYGSLLDHTYRSIVRRQMDYGRERGIPWGVSESGYNARDRELTYQYSNFGVPGLGLKRGLSQEWVVAPYATCLATMIDPVHAVANLHRLTAAGANGMYGFYEALDYTPERLPEDEKVAIVQEYMTHHQAMSLIAFHNVIYKGLMRTRFHADPQVQATELLLQERTPRHVAVTRSRAEEADVKAAVSDDTPPVVRRFRSPHQPTPRTHLLSNGRYSVMITTAGSGYSRWRDLAVTRWREDVTRDAWGTYIFFRDVESGKVWSAGFQPTGAEPDDYEVDFSEERAEFVRRDGSLLTKMEVMVSPEDDAEIRRVTIRNVSGRERWIEVTSYAEIVLATPAADSAHPAFSNLFVQTEFVSEVNSLLCSRRPRQPTDAPVWAAHVIVVKGDVDGPVQYESDRAQFLGRGRGIRTPMCVIDGKPLTNTTGPVLDPVVSLRQRLKIAPGQSVQVSFITLVASTRESALSLADKYHDPAMFERTATLAWTQALVQQHYLSIGPHEAHLFQDLASRILYSDAALRPTPDVLARNTRGAPGLWAHGISGDIPIVLVRIDDVEDRDIIRQLLHAYEYWHMKNLTVDLVIINEKLPSYIQELQNALEELVQATQTSFRQASLQSPGRIFLLRADRLTPEDRLLLQTAARVVLLSRHGSLSEQVARFEQPDEDMPAELPKRTPRAGRAPAPMDTADLEFFNGLGGFAEDGREYVTQLGPEQWTPAPWINVVSNPSFGFQASECGSGFTWSENSRENQLTPWSNDPVSDPCGDIFYLRDLDSGEVWTPTALPIREEAFPYRIRHGQGYSVFEHASHEIALQMIQFVPPDDSLKISRLSITNRSSRTRRLSVTSYLEWVLGFSRPAMAPFVVTEREPQTGALLARNAWNTEFGNRIAFADLGGEPDAWTADRTEFIGRNGTLDHPVALEYNRRLSGKVGAGLDPCAVLQKTVTIPVGGRVDVVLFLGQAADRGEAVRLIQKYRKANIDDLLALVRKNWEDVLEAVQIHTPQRSMDVLVNRWLLYQTLACRVWSRSAFYQAGGAYGFRDQLQDVMALTVSRPGLAREQILRAAGRQFPEGDVQHWWHPPTGRGVRTHISDDLIWLPYVVTHYVEVTGDTSILNESISFLESRPISAGAEDAYFEPHPSTEKATLLEHCARTLDRSLTVGTHGLPLMGSGDWNDGMNRIGSEGKGESVWLAWFLHTTLWEFAKLAEKNGETARAEKWRLHVGDLKAAIEKNGWDGDWYKRAYFDDGTPVGSATNEECRIDAIAQSWGVISGAADPARGVRAMSAVEDQLVKRKDGLILLFTPPFDKTPKNPGYIKGYLPGVRENGGQYTHAAAWTILAFAALGQGAKATELFNLLNPISHGSSRAGIHRYKVEPYVMAGDVYSEEPHTGRGGWTWYTGSAGWMYRAAVEWILGVRLRGTTLFLDPCIPPAWPSYEVNFRYHSARYEIKVENPKGVARGIQFADMDGKPIRGGAAILLANDGLTHRIRVVLG